MPPQCPRTHPETQTTHTQRNVLFKAIENPSVFKGERRASSWQQHLAIVLPVLGEVVWAVQSVSGPGRAQGQERPAGSGWARTQAPPLSPLQPGQRCSAHEPHRLPPAHSANPREPGSCRKEPWARPFNVSFQKTLNPSPGRSLTMTEAYSVPSTALSHRPLGACFRGAWRCREKTVRCLSRSLARSKHSLTVQPKVVDRDHSYWADPGQTRGRQRAAGPQSPPLHPHLAPSPFITHWFSWNIGKAPLCWLLLLTGGGTDTLVGWLRF